MCLINPICGLLAGGVGGGINDIFSLTMSHGFLFFFARLIIFYYVLVSEDDRL